MEKAPSFASLKYNQVKSWLVRTRSKTARGIVRFFGVLVGWPKLSIALFLIILLSILIVRDFFANEIILELLEIDPSLKTRVSPSIVTKQLLSEMTYLKRETNTSFKQYGSVVDAPLLVPINIKTGPFETSTSALADLVRNLLGRPRQRITGTVLPDLKDPASIHVILYTPNNDAVSCNSKVDISDSLLECAEKISAAMAPYPMAAYFFQRRRWNEALEQTLRVMRDPNKKIRKWGFNLYGQLCLQELDFSTARESYENALSIDKTFAPALIDLGNLERIDFSKSSPFDSKKAENYYRSALKSKNAIAATNLADLFVSHGKSAEAEQLYRRATSLDPNLAAPYLGLGELAINKNDLGNAKIWFGHAAQLSLDKAIPYIRWGIAYLEMGNYPAAERRFQLATSANGANKQAWAWLAHTLVKENNYSEAREAILKALPDWYQATAEKAAPDKLNLDFVRLVDLAAFPYDASDEQQTFAIIAIALNQIAKCGAGWERDPQKCSEHAK